ncbi:MAG: hypothetical protein U1E51_16940 [Candidatus Binatia bacterium]|nr:hypothetical protein [Candidatus Binatia bacterium]
MTKNEHIVIATLKAAAEACKQTCGEWDIKKIFRRDKGIVLPMRGCHYEY